MTRTLALSILLGLAATPSSLAVPATPDLGVCEEPSTANAPAEIKPVCWTNPDNSMTCCDVYGRCITL